jgi:hypothetical protein
LEAQSLQPLVPGRELGLSTIFQTGSGLWVSDGGQPVAHLAFEDRNMTRALGQALEGGWRFGSDTRWQLGRTDNAWAEDGGTAAVVLRASATSRLMRARQRLTVEHAGHVFEWKKSPWPARFTLSGDGRSIVVVRGAVTRARIELGTPPSASASLALLMLFTLFIRERVLAGSAS